VAAVVVRVYPTDLTKRYYFINNIKLSLSFLDLVLRSHTAYMEWTKW